MRLRSEVLDCWRILGFWRFFLQWILHFSDGEVLSCDISDLVLIDRCALRLCWEFVVVELSS